MAWLPANFGRDPGEIAAAAGMAIHGGSLPSGLLQRRNPLVDALKNISPELKEYFKRKRQDAIANQLQNMINPPRAGAVDQNSYDPSLAASQGLGNYQEGGDSPDSYNLDSVSPPTTQPYRGGAEGNAANQLYQKYLAQQEAAKSDTATNDLNYQVLYRKAHPEEFPDKMTGPQYVNTDQGRMTAHEASVIQRDQNKANARGVGGLTLDQLNQPGYVRYEDKDGNVRSTEEAQADPEGTFAVPPGAKQRTPFTQWNSAADLYRKAVAPKVMGKTTDAAAQPDQSSQGSSGMTKADYDAMPSGTTYTAPDGTRRVKK